MNCKIALVFLVVLAVVLKSSQGKSIHDIKDDLEDAKKTVVIKKLAIAKGVAAKIKLAAFKKWVALKALAKAPFVLGKKAALLKIEGIKSLAAYKAAKLKKVLGYAAEKTAPAVAVVAGIPAAAVAAIPAVLKPKPVTHSELGHHTEVVDIYTYPGHGQNYQEAQHHIPANSHYYKSGLDAPRTYTNDYSLVPENNSGSQYYPVSDIIQPHETYGVPAN
ncbi:uncharacterized protein LOC129907758 [Episyrphus balteatus]|uniref:uncharacterized protein LOC129907758 n=1 Tax=Episyrphus balteatus TaxID=286459 RepID=UPI0024862E17|nr:uncharacterized protein LOC129907758 [Episyrphus balteatus]